MHGTYAVTLPAITEVVIYQILVCRWVMKQHFITREQVNPLEDI